MSDPIDTNPSNACGLTMECPLDVSHVETEVAPAHLGGADPFATFDEAMVTSLEARGYRVLRRVLPPPPAIGPLAEGTGVAIGLDLETTGRCAQSDEIIEVALVRFRYDLRTGRLLGTEGTFSALREPTIPLPDAVSRLTKIDSTALVGRQIDAAALASFVSGARLVVAHNAAFDRRFAERAWPVFATLPWACSCTGIDWSELGFEGAKLSHLVMQSGFFHHGHRATDDVFAMLHCLQLEMFPIGSPVFLSLLETARAPTERVWADGAPFAMKDLLKRRGYRWSSGEDHSPRAWYRDVARAAVDEEISFLRSAIYEDYLAEPRVVTITAYDRYSDRAGLPIVRGAAP